jgi:hypothetical protein
MNFREWLIKEEEQGIDAKDILYTACVLHRNSQEKLVTDIRKLMFEEVGTDIPKGWTIRAHHMTVKFKPLQADIEAIKQWFGKEIWLTVVDWAADNFGIAAVVKPSVALPMDQIPHITIAHAKEVNPKYSNTLLADKTKWHPVHSDIKLMSFLAGITGSNQIIPDLNPIPLAAPVL